MSALGSAWPLPVDYKYGFGVPPQATLAPPNGSPLSHIGGPAAGDTDKLYHPAHPLFWFFGVAAVAAAAMYHATTVRVSGSGHIGKLGASVSAGKEK